jgi:hypothetical protein
MSDTAEMKRARRLARRKGYLLQSLGNGYGEVIVVQCAVHGSACRADRYEMEHGHWRSHHDVSDGQVEDVTAWLQAQPDEADAA